MTGANAWWVPRLRNNSDIDLIMGQFVKASATWPLHTALLIPFQSGVKVIRSWGYATVANNSNIPPPQTSIYGSWFQLVNKTGTYINYGDTGPPGPIVSWWEFSN